MSSGEPDRRLGCAWYLTGACNYACPYCYDQVKPTRHPRWDMADVRRVFGALTEARGPLDIALTGGEPTLHPLFGEVVAHLSSHGHSLLVSSNLSCGAEPFLRHVADPSRCSVNASFHPSHARMAAFASIVRRLLDAGFGVVPSYVTYPPHLAEKPRHAAELRRVAPETTLSDLTFVGAYEGVAHPIPAPAAANVALPPAPPRPRRCRAGADYFAILSDGRVMRCVGPTPLFGDRWPTVRLADGPVPCPQEHCWCTSMHGLWVAE
ncbi:MAG: radical SAM protein [Armatimonadetes bacterium]|nr:radical SAM protein [Armatimonadota bacterium]